jgi:hypothetical protein
MKVRVTLTIDVDPEAWVLAYGCLPKDVREDVKTYVAGCMAGSAAADEDAIQNVTIR